MGFIDGFILLALLAVGIPVAGVLGWLIRTVFRTSRFSALPLLIVLATVVAGAPLALRMAGVQTDARVDGRDERVHVDSREGGWASESFLSVRFRPTDARRADPSSRPSRGDSVDAVVTVGAAEFDRTPVGALVPVTYVSWRPSIAKLADRTVGDFWRDLLGVGGMATGLAFMTAFLCAVIAWNWSPEAAALRTLRRGANVRDEEQARHAADRGRMLGRGGGDLSRVRVRAATTPRPRGVTRTMLRP